MSTMRKTNTVAASPAVEEWRAREQQWDTEAARWVRTTLEQWFTADSTYSEKTAANVMDMVDNRHDHPAGWARLLVNPTATYRKRYDLIRNALETLARARVVATGTTVNANGRSGSATYARARSPADIWEVTMSGPPGDVAYAKNRALQWLEAEGDLALRNITTVSITRKQGPGGRANGLNSGAAGTGIVSRPVKPANRRKRRITEDSNR